VSVERNVDSDVFWVGGRYGAGGQLTFGLNARFTKEETPLYRPLLPLELTGGVPTLSPTLEPDESDRQDLDFNITWRPSGLSTVNTRVSLTKQDHTAPSRSDFSGVTGKVLWEYAPTGKTTLRSALVRDTGAETSFLSLTDFGLAGLRFDNNRLNWIVLGEADWAATSKILVTSGLHYIHGTIETLTGQEFSSNQTRFRLGARYQATRAASLGCDFLTDTGSAIASAVVFGCSAQFVLR
jgi:hypothetical protein